MVVRSLTIGKVELRDRLTVFRNDLDPTHVRPEGLRQTAIATTGQVSNRTPRHRPIWKVRLAAEQLPFALGARQFGIA